MNVQNNRNELNSSPHLENNRLRRVYVLERTIALALAVTLLRSAFAHLGNLYYFLSTVYSYRLTGIETGQWIALVFPFLQLVAALSLLCRWWMKEIYTLTFLLFSLYFGAQMIIFQRGVNISCGCFGASESLKVGPLTLCIAGGAAIASLLGRMLVHDQLVKTESGVEK